MNAAPTPLTGSLVTGSFCIARAHPCLDGHFPGRPLVPGVVLLAEILAIIRPLLGPGVVPVGFDAVKFLAPVGPDRRVTVQGRLSEAAAIFSAEIDGVPVVRGTARFAGPP